jgi:hypothetical protein
MPQKLTPKIGCLNWFSTITRLRATAPPKKSATDRKLVSTLLARFDVEILQNMISVGTAVRQTANLEPQTYGPASLLDHMLVANVQSALAPM